VLYRLYRMWVRGAAFVVNRLDNHPNELTHALTARAFVERFQADLGVGGRAAR
jgi:hypothetical protein